MNLVAAGERVERAFEAVPAWIRESEDRCYRFASKPPAAFKRVDTAVRRALRAALVLALAAGGSAMGQDDGGAERPWIFFGDLRLRGEFVDRPVDDIRRALISLRGGILWTPAGAWELGLAGRLNGATEDVFLVTDNEERNGLRLDRAFARWLRGASGELTVGKTEMPLWLSPMVWDEDMRPIGISYTEVWAARRFDSLRLAAGYFAGDHRFDDESRIGAVQLLYSIREGARRGGEVGVSYLVFDDLEALAATGLARANRRSGSTFVSDFELLALQISARTGAGAGVLTARLDGAENLGAKDEDQGLRFSLTWRRNNVDHPLQVGAVAQRIQADAVVAAFNSDDWWFHSAMRGVAAWIGKTFPAGYELRLAGFSERSDELNDRFLRILIDLRREW